MMVFSRIENLCIHNFVI